MRFSLCWGVILILPLVACAHEKPFQPDSFSRDSARTGGSPRQLTYNLGTDRAPAWLPGDSGFIYSTERLDTPSRHRCLARMAAVGGTIDRTDCKNFARSIDSTYSFEWPAIRPGGDISFLLVANRITAVRPGYQSLRLGRLDNPDSSLELLILPYRVDTAYYNAILSPHWLDSTRMIFIAGILLIGEPPIPTDTFYGGRSVATLDRQNGVTVVNGIPGTDHASSVAANPGAAEFYFTVEGDSRVFWSDLSGSSIQVYYDFGPGQVARDVAAHGDSLLVVVGGRVVLYDFEEVGQVQQDFGDKLRLINPGSGLDRVVGDTGLCYRRPAFSRNGRTLLAEGYATSDGMPCTLTSTTAPEGNIWVIDLQ